MPDIAFYFQAHQPYRIHRFHFLDVGSGKAWFDDDLNSSILRRIADNCYTPASAMLYNMISEYDIKLTFGISGTLIHQLHQWAPDAANSFTTLLAHPNVSILAETYYHSLSSLYSSDEFVRQVEQHTRAIKSLTGKSPRGFRNTELLCSDQVLGMVSGMGYDYIITEGSQGIMQTDIAPDHALQYHDLKIYFRDHIASDDIAFRRADRKNAAYRISAQDFLDKLEERSLSRYNIWMDYEALGEHNEDEFLHFFRDLIVQGLSRGYRFVAIEDGEPQLRQITTFENTVSWADAERDDSAWRGNAMQRNALERVYGIEREIINAANPDLTEDWGRLQASDHFYYMSTKTDTDGDVHRYFSPFRMPHDAFVYYMNILTDLEQKLP